MLNPTWLENAPDAMMKIWEQAEDEILKSMADMISKYDYMIPSAMHQKQLLEATGATQQQVAKALAGITGKAEEEIQSLMTEAGNKVIEDDGKVYKQADIYKADAVDKEALNNVVRTGISQAMSELQNITRTTANAAGTQIYKLLDNAWMQVSSGATSYNQAIAAAVKSLADGGLDSFVYPSGHVDKLDVAVRRAVVTGVNQTAGRLSNELADELGCDLVEVSAHSGARPSHAEWQGKIYSRSGESKKYPKLSTATGYGTGAGLCGWNCRHTFGPWVEGSDRVWSDKELEGLKKKDYEYNGVKMTEYEASQKQRYIERQIRKYKRGEALGVEGSSEKVKEWQRTQADFIDQTGLKRQYDRENVYIKSYRQTNSVDISMDISYNVSRSLKKSVSIPDDCKFLLQADTNFEGKDISEDVLRAINDAIAKRNSEKSDFIFDEIKVASFAESEKSVMVTNYQSFGGRHKTQLYLNKQYFYGVSLEDLNSMCEEFHAKGWWKSKTFEDLVNHEIMHARIAYNNSIEKTQALYDTLMEDNRVFGFCRFVDTHPDEFMNEMYVALCNGETVDNKFITVYEQYSDLYLR